MNKIIVTIGPAIFETGIYIKHQANYIYRINGAHSTRESLIKLTGILREEIDSPNILIDLPGNKIRTANVVDPIKISNGTNFKLSIDKINFPDFINFVQEGQIVYADDSTLKFRVESLGSTDIVFRSFSNGYLKNGKGLHVRGIHSEIPFLFQKDLDLIDAANEMGLDFIGLSFVRDNNDINQAKELIKNSATIIPKVETISAVENLDQILINNNYILIDRGDLSTDVGLEKVPLFQNYIIQKANQYNKGVFLATQFLKNMELKPVPTIAEINDLYNTFHLEGVIGIQLSEETAVGNYPQKCLDIINKLELEFSDEMVGSSNVEYFKNYIMKKIKE